MNEKNNDHLLILAETFHVIGKLVEDPKLRNDLRSSLAVTAAALEVDVNTLLPHGRATSEAELFTLHDELLALRAQRPHLKTQISRARRAIRRAGFVLPDGRGDPPLAGPWLQYLARLQPSDQILMLPFSKACDRVDAEPDTVNDSIASQIADAHVVTRDVKSATQTVRSWINTWNFYAPRLGLALLSMPIPYVDRGLYGLSDPAFNTRFLAELDRCIETWTTVPRRGRVLKSATAAARRYLVLLTVSAFCKATGRAASEFVSLEDFLTINNLLVAFRFMRNRAPEAVQVTERTDGIYQAARTIRDVADLVLPTDREFHTEIRKIVRAQAPGSEHRPAAEDQAKVVSRDRRRRPRKARLPSRRKQNALLPLLDEDYAHWLRSRPYSLYAELASEERLPRHKFTLLTHAAATEIMFATAAWTHEVARLEIGKQLLIVCDQLSTRYFVRISPGETNHRVARDFELTGISKQIIETYLTQVRPNRSGHETQVLFPNKFGEACHPNSIGQSVCRLVSRPEHRMSSKDLRAVVAVMYGMGSEGADTAIQRYLGRRQTENDPIINLIAAWRATRRKRAA